MTDHRDDQGPGGRRGGRAGPGVLYPEESYAILGACFGVYTDKGCGFLEPV